MELATRGRVRWTSIEGRLSEQRDHSTTEVKTVQVRRRMPDLNDCYVLAPRRSADVASEFIMRFVPRREPAFAPEDPSEVLDLPTAVTWHRFADALGRADPHAQPTFVECDEGCRTVRRDTDHVASRDDHLAEESLMCFLKLAPAAPARHTGPRCGT
jgi:hypothetical protein